MSKVIYRYNPDTDIYYGNLKVSDSYIPQAGESLLPVPEGLFEPIKHIVDNEGKEGWLGTPKEEWEKANPGTPAKPSAQQTAMVALGQQVGNLIVENQTLKTQLEKSAQATQALGELVAPLVAKQNASQGGN